MKLLVAMDASSFAKAALDKALELAAPCKAQVVVLSVVPNLGIVEEMPQKLVDRLKREAESVLAEAKDRAAKAGVTVETLLQSGTSPADTILDAAAKAKADLIVIGHRGSSNLERFLIGSVAHALVTYAPCSVLVVK